MSILNVDKIQPIGSGSTVTVNATDTILTNAQAGVITATRFDGIISATTDDWITHQSDSNTRMGFPAVDTFSVETAGSERLRITSTGLLSIGDESNLDSQLTVTQGQGDCIRLRSNATNNTFKYGIIKQEPYNNNALGVQIIGGKSDSGYSEVAIGGGIDGGYAATHIDFYTGATTTTTTGTRKLRIDSSGRLMVGNTAAANLYSVANRLVVGDGGGSEGMTIYSDSSNDGIIAFADGTSDPAYRMGQIIYSHNSNAMQFRTGGNTERLRIESDGDIVATGNLKTNNLPGRNLLINGAMRVNQKGNLTHNSDGYQVADMWWWGKYSTDQLVTTQANVTNDHPDEFDHSYKLSVATAETTLDNNEYGILRTRIEGQNLQHLKTGTASAKELTLSFWAKTASANSGDTYSVCIVMGDISGNDRIQYRTFTPTSTWQRFTMSFVGQTNNQIRNDHDYGLTLHYVLAAGSSKVTSANTTWSLNTGIKGVTGQSNFFDNTSNEFYVTGVQLEVGSIATEYEHKSYDEEIIRCLRYYYKYAYNSGTTSLGTGIAWSSAEIDVPMKFPVPMRIKPTSIEQGSGANYFQIEGGGQTPATYVDGNWSLQFSNNYGGNIYATPDQSLTPGRAHHVVMRQSAAYIAFVAEL